MGVWILKVHMFTTRVSSKREINFKSCLNFYDSKNHKLSTIHLFQKKKITKIANFVFIYICVIVLVRN